MARPALSLDAVESMRDRLANAALSICRARGVDALSFRRLAESASISHTLLYRYFSDKDALLARVRADRFAAFEDFVRARERPDAGMAAHIHSVAHAYVEYACCHPADYRLMFSTEQPPPDRYPELLAARRSLFEHAVDIVRHYVDSGDMAGNERLITHAFWINLHGLMTLHVANQLVHGAALDELVDPIIDRLIAGGASTGDKP